MKGFVTFLVLALVIVGAYLLINKPINTPAPKESSGDIKSNDSSNSSDIHSVDPNMNGTKELNNSTSSAKWTGTKTLIKDYKDTGTINIKSGNAVFVNGILTGGTVVFDMNSIATTSTGVGDESDKLSMQATHMKSDDFFDSAKYPEAIFVMKSGGGGAGQSYLISGDLTIKGVTNSVEFPVNVDEENGIATLSGAVSLDRTLWGIKYGSDKFFKDLGDKVIGDTFTLEFNAVTK